jgi:AhpD family alkylhydroperoxidase
MPKIPYAEKDRVGNEAKATYAQLEKGFGVVPNVVKLLGHSEPVVRTFGTMLGTYFNELSLPVRIRELAYVTVARYNGCAYCQGHHTPLLKKEGLSDEQVELLGDKGWESDRFEPAEQAVIRFAYETARDVEASNEAVEGLKRHFELPQIAEIAFTVASANFIQRIGKNFGAELEF